jgi:hypothetical protein
VRAIWRSSRAITAGWLSSQSSIGLNTRSGSTVSDMARACEMHAWASAGTSRVCWRACTARRKPSSAAFWSPSAHIASDISARALSDRLGNPAARPRSSTSRRRASASPWAPEAARIRPPHEVRLQPQVEVLAARQRGAELVHRLLRPPQPAQVHLDPGVDQQQPDVERRHLALAHHRELLVQDPQRLARPALHPEGVGPGGDPLRQAPQVAGLREHLDRAGRGPLGLGEQPARELPAGHPPRRRGPARSARRAAPRCGGPGRARWRRRRPGRPSGWTTRGAWRPWRRARRAPGSRPGSTPPSGACGSSGSGRSAAGSGPAAGGAPR